MDILLVLTTLPDRAQAEALGTALVDARHAACATVLPGARSIYRWQGVVETADEALLRTAGLRLPPLRRAFAGLTRHPSLAAVTRLADLAGAAGIAGGITAGTSDGSATGGAS